MVRVAPPPPTITPSPIYHTLAAATNLIRLFDPTRHGTAATTFRYYGPLHRFDHHLSAGAPGIDAQRGVYYAGFSLSCCVAEVFGDTGFINCGEWHVAAPRLTRGVRLLDLCGSGAMRAGTVAALAKVPDHALAQAWSRCFYDAPEYDEPEGLLWYNAHNDEEALVLYERAQDALDCSSIQTMRLDDAQLRPALELIAQTNNLVVMP